MQTQLLQKIVETITPKALEDLFDKFFEDCGVDFRISANRFSIDDRSVNEIHVFVDDIRTANMEVLDALFDLESDSFHTNVWSSYESREELDAELELTPIKIGVEIPEGYEAVEYRLPKVGESYFDGNRVHVADKNFDHFSGLIVRPIDSEGE